MEQGFGKLEKLKSTRLIDQLFAEGNTIKKYPIRLVYIPISSPKDTHFKTGFSVSKRNFKTAVSRNRVKRLLRESFRKNKYIVLSSTDKTYAFMFIYLSREILSQQEIERCMISLLKQFSSTIR
ncbi:ribonuclease P protein component [Zunongwangia sp.]|uniref:ribonuclease P protein component n=1 Tax=Zunongwangia sp. TaxID=1965325 RepID=UPI003AA8AB55